MRLLVTGAGRTGTWWLTHALRSCGIDAQHEVAYSLDRHGDGDWSCEVSWLAAPFTPVADAYVVHMTRHPLAQIASRAAWGSFEDQDPPGPYDQRGPYDPRPKGRYAIDWCPDIARGRTPVERAAIHWVRWNELVVADEILRLEDCTPAEVWRLASIVDPRASRPRIGPPVNRSHRPPTLTWADVDHVAGLRDLAARYGYSPRR